jgi:tetratricopeptide (TPR) repeat protein
MDRALGCLLAAAMMLVAGAALAQPSDAERLYNQGQQAYDAKNYGAALEAWQRSYELSKLPALVFNIAQAQRLHGDCRAAVDSYRKFVELDPTSSERADAETWLKELQPCPVAKPPPKVITPPVGGHPPKTEPPGHPGQTKRVVGLTMIATGVAVAATGLWFGNKASSLADELDADCADGCAWDTIRDKDAEGRSAERTQLVLYGVGAAVAITGGIVYFLGARERPGTITVAPRSDGAVVGWRGSF